MAATLAIGAMVAAGHLIKYEFLDPSVGVQAAQSAIPQAVPVNVIEVVAEPVRLWSEFSGHLTAIDSAEIRPQVSGTITQVLFTDGQMVKKGDVLAIIDPRPFAAAMAEAEADLTAARHDLVLAKKQRARAESLIDKGHVSERVLDERINDHTVAISAVKRAEAQLEQAKINFDHAHIKAPISGRLSRVEITLGNLVEAGPNAPILTSIVAMDGVYAEFDVDERTYLRGMHQLAKSSGATTTLPVELIIDMGDKRVYQGHIHSFDNQIDPATGTIRARAIFSNDDGSLLPGIFADVRLGAPNSDSLILLSSSAVGTDQDRKFIYVIDETNTVVYRQVTLGASVGKARVIANGLEAGEKVMVGGLMKVRPGMVVEPMLIDETQEPAVSQNPQTLAAAN
ncbi:MAG: efflux RND transporter periplasmic adaptor subunit [Pseudomonadota bacterium]